MRTQVPVFAAAGFPILLLTVWLYHTPSPRRAEVSGPELSSAGQGGGESLNYFLRKEEANGYLLTYGWKDLKGKIYYTELPVSKADLSAAEAEFGYDPEALRTALEAKLDGWRREMIAHLNDLAAGLIRKSPYAGKISMDRTGPLSINIKISASPSEYEDVKKEFTRITGRITAEQQAWLEKMDGLQKDFKIEYLRRKGIRVIDDRIGVDYSRAVKNNRERMNPVYQSLKRSSGRMSIQSFLALMVSFFQEIRFGIPPRKERGKMILEFWTPPRVLVDNFGDCDSKGVAFASIWTNYSRYPLVLINLPKHMLLGVAVPARQGEGFTINGLRYTLFEVTGPHKIPPGMIAQYSQMYLSAGNYSYELFR